jgi:uncharacterized protein YbjQ (UPF0145 family)
MACQPVFETFSGVFMVVTTSNEVEGFRVSSYLGLVRGIVVRSPNIAQGLLGGLKQMVGGNIETFAQVCETAREHAYERMEQHAAEIGADAVIAVRYDATEFSQSATEVLCYGTAVKLTRSA